MFNEWQFSKLDHGAMSSLIRSSILLASSASVVSLASMLAAASYSGLSLYAVPVLVANLSYQLG